MFRSEGLDHTRKRSTSSLRIGSDIQRLDARPAPSHASILSSLFFILAPKRCCILQLSSTSRSFLDACLGRYVHNVSMPRVPAHLPRYRDQSHHKTDITRHLHTIPIPPLFLALAFFESSHPPRFFCMHTNTVTKSNPASGRKSRERKERGGNRRHHQRLRKA